MSTQSSASKVVYAAGAVLWRPGHRESAAEVAVIHRSALRRLVTAQRQSRSRRDRAGDRSPRGT